jgi:hypothetical protein
MDLVVVGHGQEATVRNPINPKVIMGKVHTDSALDKNIFLSATFLAHTAALVLSFKQS